MTEGLEGSSGVSIFEYDQHWMHPVVVGYTPLLLALFVRQRK